MWRIQVLEAGSDTGIDHHYGEDADHDYSDIVTLTNSWDFKWVVGGKGFFKTL